MRSISQLSDVLCLLSIYFLAGWPTHVAVMRSAHHSLIKGMKDQGNAP